MALGFKPGRDKDGQLKLKVEPFTAKTVLKSDGSEGSLFKRVHGMNGTVTASSTQSLVFTVPYITCKFSGADIFGVDLKDTLNFKVLDTDNNDVSGLDVGTFGPNVLLNQFGFDVEMPGGGKYSNTSNYDADLVAGMKLVCEYTNNGLADKYIAMNVELHEVK